MEDNMVDGLFCATLTGRRGVEQVCGVVKTPRFLGGVGCLFVPLRMPKLRIPVETVQFLLKLFLQQIYCCTSQFLLILTTKFHSLGAGVGYFTSYSATLVSSIANNHQNFQPNGGFMNALLKEKFVLRR